MYKLKFLVILFIGSFSSIPLVAMENLAEEYQNREAADQSHNQFDFLSRLTNHENPTIKEMSTIIIELENLINIIKQQHPSIQQTENLNNATEIHNEAVRHLISVMEVDNSSTEFIASYKSQKNEILALILSNEETGIQND